MSRRWRYTLLTVLIAATVTAAVFNPFTGVFAVSFVMAFVSLSLYCAYHCHKKDRAEGKSSIFTLLYKGFSRVYGLIFNRKVGDGMLDGLGLGSVAAIGVGSLALVGIIPGLGPLAIGLVIGGGVAGIILRQIVKSCFPEYRQMHRHVTPLPKGPASPEGPSAAQGLVSPSASTDASIGSTGDAAPIEPSDDAASRADQSAVRRPRSPSS